MISIYVNHIYSYKKIIYQHYLCQPWNPPLTIDIMNSILSWSLHSVLKISALFGSFKNFFINSIQSWNGNPILWNWSAIFWLSLSFSLVILRTSCATFLFDLSITSLNTPTKFWNVLSTGSFDLFLFLPIVWDSFWFIKVVSFNLIKW